MNLPEPKGEFFLGSLCLEPTEGPTAPHHPRPTTPPRRGGAYVLGPRPAGAGGWELMWGGDRVSWWCWEILEVMGELRHDNMSVPNAPELCTEK